MKRQFVIIPLFLIIILPVYAGHISGGEIFYKYQGPGAQPNTDKFSITLRLFKDRNAGGSNTADMPARVTLGIFKRTGPFSYTSHSFLFPVARTRLEVISVTPSAYPCINPPPRIEYEVGYFETSIDLPREPLGYTIAFQTCCRANGITNMEALPIPGSGNFGDGATYVATIPGTDILGTTTNSGPEFRVKDTAIVCADNRFELDFGADDPDGDVLTYSFCSAYNRGSSTGAGDEHKPSTPPYDFITYTPGFSGSQPLGPNVTINPSTGLITGVAPSPGKYVINVCIDEWRNNVKIGEHRKDFILEVKSCNIAGAALAPEYITCDGLTLTFQNQSNSPLVNSWTWDFGISGTDTDISTEERPTFTFPAAGTYNVKLVVNKGQQCSDSAFTVAKVYPGFFPDFRVEGSCILNDFRFIDISRTNHGVINKWRWKFGDETTTADVSSQQHPTWKYSTTGFKQVEAIIESSMGCIDTIVANNVEVRDKPAIDLAFRDTLICSVDVLQLKASGLGDFYWTPDQQNISRFNNTANPEVFPKTTTTFKVTLNDDGCINTDSVKVRVVDFVTLDAGPDTTICLTDPVELKPSGDGLYYEWTPAQTLDDPLKRNPIATPTATTTYRVKSSISANCFAEDVLTVRTVPYPFSDAGDDVIICYEDTIQLNGTIDGLGYSWSPANTLINPNTLTPLAFPLNTTSYVLSVVDNKGCDKPGRDTVVVTVRPKILANAGNDTSIVVGQPLLLNASGADFFEWSPATGLDDPNIQRPTAILSDNITYVVRVFTPEECFNYDTINVKVFKTFPDIFVPNAFTPGKATNSLFRPIPVGIATLDFFRVYNRWGQLVYSTNSTTSRGWDGKVAGRDQDQGTYVWMVQGRDYTGKLVSKKGTMVLIR